MNPIGRTGLQGRGALSAWGPNHAADPIVTRIDDDGRLQVAVGVRTDVTGDKLALPGGYIDKIEYLANTSMTLGSCVAALREFKEEMLSDLEGDELKQAEKGLAKLVLSSKEIYKGYADDDRNTDNAWMETIAYHFHIEDRALALRFAGTNTEMKAGSRHWLTLPYAPGTPFYGTHKSLVDKMFKSWNAKSAATPATSRPPSARAGRNSARARSQPPPERPLSARAGRDSARARSQPPPERI
jgi:ADP-ribose pyrophosphatase